MAGERVPMRSLRSEHSETRCTPLIERVQALPPDSEASGQSLGELWYSGVLGGVPDLS